MTVDSSILSIRNSVFDGNIADESPAIYLTTSTLYSENNIFRNQI